MKTRLSLPVRHFILAGAISTICAAAFADPSASDNLRDGVVKQQQLQGEASGIAGQLDAMIGEYQRNGLTGEDVETVKALRDSMNRLSGTEMQQVVTLLEKARATSDAGTAKKVVSDAYAAQKGILVEMKKLLAEHQRNQQALELSAELSQLADRQAANLQNGIELGKWSGGEKPANFEAALQAHLEGQQTEQKAIDEELKILANKIGEFAKAAETPDRAARFEKGVEAAKKLGASTEAASNELQAGQIFKAVSDEKVARDSMRKLAREVAPAENSADALRQAERDLEKLSNEQRDIVTRAQKIQGAPAGAAEEFKRAEAAKERTIAKLPPEARARVERELQALKNRGAQGIESGAFTGLDEQQGDIANKADLAAQDLDKNAPAAAQALKAAMEKMQETRGALADRNADDAVKNANAAAAALDAARAQVAQLTGQEANRTPEEAAKNLQQLDQAAKELAKREAAAAANPDKSQQAALANQIQQLAQMGAAAAPAAANALQQAADAAQMAADAAAANQQAQAGAAQQAAAQDLAKAEQQMAQNLAQNQQAQQQLADAQKAQESLATIIKAEQDLERDTAKSTAQFQPKKEYLFKGQNDRQDDIKTRTGTFKTSLSPDFAAALSALTDATIDMGQAKSELDKPNGPTADDAEKKALADLYRVQDILGKKAEAAQAELGQPQENQQAEANAAQQAAQAQADVDKAMQTMEKAAGQQGQQAAATMQQAARQLAKAAQEAGQLAAGPAQAGEAAQQAAQAAAQDLSQAAAQAAGQNQAGAQAAAQQGQQDLAAIQAALAQAKAGLAQAGNEGMPTEPGQPGEHQGPPHAGNHPGTHAGEIPGVPGTKAAQNYHPGGESGVQKSTRVAGTKSANFSGLPARERAAIEQAQSEKYPEEYGTLVEQYLRNLAAESSGGAKP